MTDPLTPERLAELRRIATGEDWSPAQPEDVAALLGEIDRLAAENEQLADLDDAATRRTELQAERDRAVKRWHLEHERAETLEAENAELYRRLESIRLVASALPHTVDVRAVALLGAAIDRHAAYSEPQGDAETSGAASAQSGPPEPEIAPQRPAEGFEWAPTPCDGPGAGKPMTRGIDDEARARALAAEQQAQHPERRYRLLRRAVGPWEAVGDERAEPIDLSGELDDLDPEQTAELKRISGLDASTGIASEDEGISSADVTAQAASDARHERFEIDSEGLAVPCRTCEGRGSTTYGADCADCDGTGFALNALRTPEQWEDHYGVQVHDPDGWRTPGNPRNWNEPITLAEFARRLSDSTLRNASDPAWSQIHRDARAAEREPR